MRYLKTQYSPTEDSNHILSAEERVWRDAKWEEQCKKYNAVLREQRKCFTKKVLKYIAYASLHDSYIKDFHCYRTKLKKRHKFIIEIEFYDKYNDKIVLVKYDDVKCVNSSVDLSGYLGFGDYLYGELFYENQMYTHNFVIIFDSEINITCKRIMIYD